MGNGDERGNQSVETTVTSLLIQLVKNCIFLKLIYKLFNNKRLNCIFNTITITGNNSRIMTFAMSIANKINVTHYSCYYFLMLKLFLKRTLSCRCLGFSIIWPCANSI